MRVKATLLILFIPLLSFSLDQVAYADIIYALQNGDTDNATAMLQKQVKVEKRESEWYKLLDDAYKCTDNVTARIELLSKAVKVKNVKEVELLYFRLAVALFDAGRYDECTLILNNLRQNSVVRRFQAKCISAKEIREHPLDVNIEPMGDSINTPYDNIWPFIDNEKSRFYTTVVVGKSTVKEKNPDIQEDIFYSVYKDSIWLSVMPLQGKIRSKENEGACSITADGKYLFLAACNRRDGGGGCEIYYSIKNEDKWTRPLRAAAPMNSFSWQSTPSISSDGKTLYFSAVDGSESSKSRKSNGRLSTPQKDIYSCSVKYNVDGSLSFSDIKKLGTEINSEFDEISPCIAPYGDILYFASDGRGGMGGLDIYYSKRNEDGTWAEAVNMGYPINTHRDEFGFVVDVDGHNGYMSCNGLEGGEFWQNKRIVRIPLSAEHYADSVFESKNTDFILENVYFDTDSHYLRSESFDYLNKFAEFLTVHPKYNVVISGYTDNTGTEEHNMELSKARAESVAEYLKNRNISPSRIATEGFGSSKSLDSNESEEGRAKNRRIEVQLLIID